MEARNTLPAVAETMASVCWTGIWQATQFLVILFPKILEAPQLSH